MKKILIVEDDLSLAKQLQTLLLNNGYKALILNEFNDTINSIINSNSDLILLDINIPNLNGEYVLKEIRKTINTPVIMLTSKNTELDEVISISYGADDYITKPYNPTILLLRMEAIFKRLNNNKETLEYRTIKLNPSKSVIEVDDKEIDLSKNEMKILYYLINNKGKIVSRNEIMDYLWNTEEYIDDNTLTVNINRLRKKLTECKLEKYLETKRGQGYILLWSLRNLLKIKCFLL